MPDDNRNQRFERLYLQYFEKTVRSFIRQGQNPARAEELAQETFLRVFKGMDSIRNPDLEEAWIKTTAKNALLNDVRAKNTKFRGEGVEPDSLEKLAEQGHHPSTDKQADFRDPLEEAELNEQRDFVKGVLRGLSREAQNLYALKRRGHSDKEIASILGLSHDAVRSKLTALRKRLRAELKAKTRPPNEPGGEDHD